MVLIIAGLIPGDMQRDMVKQISVKKKYKCCQCCFYCKKINQKIKTL